MGLIHYHRRRAALAQPQAPQPQAPQPQAPAPAAAPSKPITDAKPRSR